MVPSSLKLGKVDAFEVSDIEFIIYNPLLWLSENGLWSLLLETVLPRFDADDSSTMGVIGVRRPSEVSYEVMREDMMGRGGSSDELSAKGLRSMVGVLSRESGYGEPRSLPELLRSSVCRARTWSSSDSSPESDARLPLRAREWAAPSSDEAVE